MTLCRKDIDVEQFKADDMRVDGVLHNLMTVGEAVKNIPDDMREQAPNVRWRDIGRFRDRVVIVILVSTLTLFGKLLRGICRQ